MDEVKCPLKKLITSKKARAAYINERLEKLYPDVKCGLYFEGDPFRLLVMARLSAQCTDKRVNMVSKELFKAYPDAKSMSEAPIEKIEELVRTCGVYRMKAKNIKDMSRILCEKYGGQVPSDMDELLALPGVGRKIANLIRGDVFGLPGIVADTHCIRLSVRWGLCDKADPVAVERELVKLIEPDKQSNFCHCAVEFGRDVCSARSPKCDSCPLLNT
ncbi:MAG: endonuclease III [Ruminococcaceae bacterium]|nr:endonuclease III [Oscillospiraceae bacterium]